MLAESDRWTSITKTITETRRQSGKAEIRGWQGEFRDVEAEAGDKERAREGKIDF